MTVLNADGSRTVTVTDYNGNGTVQIGQTVTTTTADGLSTSQNGYLDAHTARDWIENSATVINADGSRTDTTGEFLGSNVSVDEWRTTTVSADQTHLTFYDYLDGNMSTAAETRTLATNSDGSTTDTYRYGDPSLGGMLLTTINTSASGLSKTTTRNYTPAGLPANLNLTTLSGKAVYAGTASFTETTNDATVLAADGSRTETIADSKTDGSMNDSVAIATAADGLTVTTTRTGSNGSANLAGTTVSARVLGADGRWTTTVSDNTSGGTLLDQDIAIRSADGVNLNDTLTVAGLNDRVASDLLNADGTRTRTTQLYDFSNPTYTLMSQDVVTTSADGLMRTVSSEEVTGAGAYQTSESLSNVNGVVIDTRSDFE